MKYANAFATLVFVAMVYLLVTSNHVVMGWSWILVAIPPALLVADFLRKQSRKLDVTMGFLWMLVLGGWSAIGVLGDLGSSMMTLGGLPTSNYLLSTIVVLIVLAISNLVYALVQLINGNSTATKSTM